MDRMCIFVAAPHWCNLLPQSLLLAGSVLKISTVFWLAASHSELQFTNCFYVVVEYFNFLFNVWFFFYIYLQK
jgi:hypothetical protein